MVPDGRKGGFVVKGEAGQGVEDPSVLTPTFNGLSFSIAFLYALRTPSKLDDERMAMTMSEATAMA